MLKFIYHIGVFSLTLLPAATVAAPNGAFEYVRRYKVGEKFSYVHRMVQTGAGRLHWVSEGRTQHEVVRDHTPPAEPGNPPLTPNEKIQWLDFRTSNSPGKVEDYSNAARQVTGFALGLPAIIPASMPNPMPSFLWQAANSLNRIYQMFKMPLLSQLQKAGDRLVEPRPTLVKSGDGKVEALSVRCTITSLELAGLSKDRATLLHRVAPSGGCSELKLPVAEMTKPIVPGAITNAYMQQVVGGKLEYSWITEETSTKIQIDRGSGMILEADIQTVTYGRNRKKCEGNYQKCEIPSDGLGDLPWESRLITEIRLAKEASL